MRDRTAAAVTILTFLFMIPAAAAQAPDTTPAPAAHTPKTIEVAPPASVEAPVNLPSAAGKARDWVDRNISTARSSVNNLSRLESEIGTLPLSFRKNLSLRSAVEQSNRSLAAARRAMRNVSDDGNRTNVSQGLVQAHENAVWAQQIAERGIGRAKDRLSSVLERNISAARDELQRARERLERVEDRLDEEQLQEARQAMEAAEGNITAAEEERQQINEMTNATTLVASTQEAVSSIEKASGSLDRTEQLVSSAEGGLPALDIIVSVVSALAVSGFLYYRMRWVRKEEEEDTDTDEE